MTAEVKHIEDHPNWREGEDPKKGAIRIDAAGDPLRTITEALRDFAKSVEPRVRRQPVSRVISVANFRSSSFRLKEPIPVEITEEGDSYVAVSYDTDQYGQGVCPDQALEELCAAIEGYYNLLEEEAGSLSIHLDHHLSFLRMVLERK